MTRKQRKAADIKQRGMVADSANAKRWMAADSFQNFEARVGLGTNNQASQYTYGFDFISRNRVQMEAMYRSSWVVGQAVDVVAEDMTREGIIIGSEMDPEDKSKLHRAFETMAIWDKLCDTTKWARLYGGAIGVLMIDGQNPATPLRPETIRPGQFKGILVLDRWLIQPTLTDLVTEMGADIGMPKFYDVVADSMALSRQRIHYSRVIRMDGVELPYWQKISENLWGQSVIERLIDRLVAFDSTTVGAAQLVYKAHLRTVKVERLRDIIAAGGTAMEALAKQFDMIRRMQSNEGLTLIDAADDFQTDQYSFSGLDNVLQQFGMQLSGALQIPLVRLFGQSPAGLSSTGESDLRTYYDNIKAQQERRLRAPLNRLLDVMIRSELGTEPPEGFAFEFAPLWQLTEEEKANVSKSTTDSVTAALDAGLISQAGAMKELRASSRVTGIFTSITDEDIELASDEPPPPVEMNTSNDPDQNDGSQEDPEAESGEDERRRKTVQDAAPASGKAGWGIRQWLSRRRSAGAPDH